MNEVRNLKFLVNYENYTIMSVFKVIAIKSSILLQKQF